MLTVPEPVHRYLTDAAIRAGVDSLVGYGHKKVPSGLAWRELPDFYAAALAAVHVQITWASFLERVWRDVWPGTISGWEPLDPDEQIQEAGDLSPSVHQCWEEQWFGRMFVAPPVIRGTSRRRPATRELYLGLGLSSAGLTATYGTDGWPSELVVEGFDYHEDLDSWWTAPIKLDAEVVDLQPLQAAASRVLAHLT